MIVKFEFNKEKDLYNIWETANSKLSYGYNFKEKLSKNVLKICEGKEFKECREKLLNLIKSLSKVNSEKDFNKLFKETYGSNPTYRFFNKLLNK